MTLGWGWSTILKSSEKVGELSPGAAVGAEVLALRLLGGAKLETSTAF